MNSKTLEKQLKQWTGRREQIAAELSQAEQTAQAKQEEFLRSSCGVAALTEARNHVSALQASLHPLDAQIEGLKADLAAARETEAQEQDSARIAEIRNEREQVTHDYYALRDEFNASCAEFGAKFFALFERWAALRQEAGDLGAILPDRMAKREKEEPYGFVLATLLNVAGRIRERQGARIRRAA